ncbi:hypothetical protein [Nitrobacter sp.]|jgi:hypothetical protein|uniref:hypothetical protein n=1 Tax=Nitrobacter sp. TaxID=29420 RepID=UPI003F6513D2
MTRQSSYRIWRWPTAIAASSVFGLLSALLGQGGIWWALSWAALAIPLLVAVWCSFKTNVEKGSYKHSGL